MFKPLTVCAATFLVALSANYVVAQRPFAPGVLKTIAPDIDAQDSHSLPLNLPGISESYKAAARSVEWKTIDKTKTLLGQTDRIVFFRDVYQLEFVTPGLRQLNVTASNLRGELRNRNIWYLMYRVRNVGANISHEAVTNTKLNLTEFEQRVNVERLSDVTLSNRFFGNFTLNGAVLDPKTRTYRNVSYAEVVTPSIVKLIQKAEDPDRQLLDKVEMMQQVLERVPADSPEGGKWGVAVWYNVDPLIDFCSVSVGGLTNAHRIEVNPDGTLGFKYKTLHLNFYRPGDGIRQELDPVEFGIKVTDDPLDRIQVAVRYGLPGPIVRGELLSEKSLRRTLIFEADPVLDPIYFNSAVAQSLNSATIPGSIVTAFSNAGYPLGGDTTIKTKVFNQQWQVTSTVNGQPETFLIRIDTEFWEKEAKGGIRFTKSLDYFWSYE